MGDLAWLRQHMRNHVANSDPNEPTEGLLRFPNAPESSATTEGEAALGLVYQAAEVFKSIEDSANETKNIAERALEQLELATRHIQELEARQRVAEARIKEASIEMQEVAGALKLETQRADAAENQLQEFESRAITAEARAKQSEKALASIEDAIRTQLLGQRRPPVQNSTVYEGKRGAARRSA